MLVSYLPNADQHVLWPDLLELLEPAARVGGVEPWEPGDCVWVAFDGQTVFAAMVTRLAGDIAEIRCVGGSRMAEWLPEWARIVEEWAIRCRASRIKCRGRKGWGRYAERFGWKAQGPDKQGLPVFAKVLPMVSVPRAGRVSNRKAA